MKPFNMDFNDFVGQLNPLTDAQWFVCRNAGLLPEDLEGKSYFWYQQHRHEIVKDTEGDTPALPTQVAWFKRVGILNVPDTLTFDQCVSIIQAAILQDESEDRDERYISYVAEHQKKKFKQNEQRRERYKLNKTKVKPPMEQRQEVFNHDDAAPIEVPDDLDATTEDNLDYLKNFDWSKVPE